MEAQNKYAMDTIAMGSSKTNPQGIWELITRQPVSNQQCMIWWSDVTLLGTHYTQTVVWWIMVCAPTVFLVAVGYLGELTPNWWTYMLGNTVIGFIMRSFL